MLARVVQRLQHWHATSMGYQQRDSWCAPAAVQLALQLHGVRVSQKALAKSIGTTADGTDEVQLLDFLMGLGADLSTIDTRSRSEARSWLREYGPQCPIILCVDSWRHWVCLAGTCLDRVWLLDTENAEHNRRRQGRYPLTLSKVLRRWRASRSTARGEGRFYGVAIKNVNGRSQAIKRF